MDLDDVISGYEPVRRRSSAGYVPTVSRSDTGHDPTRTRTIVGDPAADSRSFSGRKVAGSSSVTGYNDVMDSSRYAEQASSRATSGEYALSARKHSAADNDLDTTIINNTIANTTTTTTEAPQRSAKFTRAPPRRRSVASNPGSRQDFNDSPLGYSSTTPGSWGGGGSPHRSPNHSGLSGARGRRGSRRRSSFMTDDGRAEVVQSVL